MSEKNIEKIWKENIWGTPVTFCYQDAGIDQHWCACLTWTELESNESMVTDAAAFMVQHVNNFTDESSLRKLCTRFSLGKVVRASMLAPNKGM